MAGNRNSWEARQRRRWRRKRPRSALAVAACAALAMFGAGGADFLLPVLEALNRLVERARKDADKSKAPDAS